MKKYLIEQEGDGPAGKAASMPVDEERMKPELVKRGVLDRFQGGWVFPGAGDGEFPQAFVKHANTIRHIDYAFRTSSKSLNHGF